MLFKHFVFLFLLCSSLITSKEYKSGLKKEDFQKEINGKKTDLYVLTNKNGLEVAVTNYGGTIAAIMVPDKNGKFLNVAHGNDSIDNILNCPKKHLSTLVGRFGNRIKDAKFSLDGKEYKLAQNNKKNHLHGGPTGFHVRVWDAEQVSENEVRMRYVSADGEEGFPGQLDMEVSFILSDDNEFMIKYKGTTSKKTIVNMTHHLFVNLDGLVDPCSSIEDHLLTLNAKFYLPTDDTQIPTGEIKKVDGTPFDFLTQRRIGERIEDNDPQLKYGDGYDHCFVVNKRNYGELSLAGKLVSPSTGRTMEIYTTEPGMQMYTANSHNNFKAYHGVTMPRRSGVAFEAQHFPNSPNMASFPSVVLSPGQTYTQTTIYKFGVEK